MWLSQSVSCEPVSWGVSHLIKSTVQTRPVCLPEVTHQFTEAFVGFFAIFWQALIDQGQRMLNSIKHTIIPCSVWVGLTHRLLMAVHNQAPWLSTWGSGHTLKNPLEMSFPLELSTLITLRQRVRGCFISFYAELPVFAHSFSDFHRVKRRPKSPWL